MQQPTLKRVDIESDYKIRFKDNTEQYGNAEFTFCFSYVRARLAQLTIYPKQQPAATEYWVMTTPKTRGRESFSMLTYTHQGLPEPKVWCTGWCKEHKGQLIRMYVPKGSNTLTVRVDGFVFSVEKEAQ